MVFAANISTSALLTKKKALQTRCIFCDVSATHKNDTIGDRPQLYHFLADLAKDGQQMIKHHRNGSKLQALGGRVYAAQGRADGDHIQIRI